LKDLLLAMVIAIWQPQYMDIERVSFIPNGISVKKFPQPISFISY
jgi:hypothetical protein